MTHDAAARDPDHHERERLLRMLAAATFVIFSQAYMVAPIIPALSSAFSTSVQTVGLVVPAYLIPYGIATLVYGLLADRARAQHARRGGPALGFPFDPRAGSGDGAVARLRHDPATLRGIVTSFAGKRPGQAMGLNVLTLFVGFGLGSLIFGEVLRFGFGAALGVFAAVELTAAVCSVWLFRSEIPSGATVLSSGSR